MSLKIFLKLVSVYKEFRCFQRKRILALGFAYAIGNASWKNGLDDDAGATSADDAESKTAAIVDEIYHFNLSPFRIQLRTKISEKHLKVPSLRHEALIIY